MPRYSTFLAAITIALFFACQNQPSGTSSQASANQGTKDTLFAVYGTPVLDGSGSDELWESCTWQPIDQVWAGQKPSATDFSGRYKIGWDENNLYLLAEITDDSLLDIYPEGLEHYWDDDCLTIFLDEDASGGPHQYNYNAFAYRIGLDGRVTDMAPDSTYRYFDDHCLARRITRGYTSSWEIAVRVFDGNQFEENGENVPKLLHAGKKIGFALAYSDNDRSPVRENLMGSVAIPGADKNRSWIDADVFGILVLNK